MIELSLGTIAEIVGGSLTSGTDPTALVTGSVEFDSRKVTAGGLFIALNGARIDGHDYAAKAVTDGAVGCLLSRPVMDGGHPVPGVIVPPIPEKERKRDSYATENDADGSVAAVLRALSLIARHVIDALTQEGLVVVGVTGSAGKTSTKDMMATIFSAAGSTVAPPGSFNNEIGHPYTALKCTTETQFLIAEMSARGIGHIAHLAAIAPPKIGVELNVGTAHVGEFGSQAAIAQAKGELVEALPDNGEAVLNADDPLVLAMASRTNARVISYSAISTEATVHATNISFDHNARASFMLHIQGENAHQITLLVAGEHQVSNALAAAAAAYAAGIDSETIARSLNRHVGASAHRMSLVSCPRNITVIDDAYNANNESMRAGLSALVHTARARGSSGWAVLGPMGELGQESHTVHTALGAELKNMGVHGLIAVGENPDSRALAAAAEKTGITTLVARTNSEAAHMLASLLHADDVVLVKASNAFALWEVADELVAVISDQELINKPHVNDQHKERNTAGE
ncbi:UDP-N-acetylmuramoyl-tripeptide--D-alanyl-D-alanine ligase [Corynebacterium silvaticum]|uniref:UDP-N-acetylmuramoyl-tripeptide--D-alanyl-D-alanine ligase n=1 Tax=Corynebacterium silvaticum TaxID=2320431 RepID=A0A7Y4LI70_9CORY|nr:UDP-N-acetylmuramoyl-tripeptide--D-alanyl-D-alanine ligase [Corynebacterium silvaticum]ARU46466.1 UDP-N-acetylmuramoyl-tripeptide--D-alanyl-D-alanine ligase [Corynebacterium silvaticum]MBH5299609.1 UDP-N-acetylmuramoyl-tripeptide--D-alanyl-D-alanine ligase [Corynebacterium silvaticum]NOM64072.1 UDP-N-acetylmuramoyl-tripeptide--D-alanyl-D-alanine ligase [Corynebacterium silvaticum]NON69277.1 UDP-N-acetylmuramoyl-tripeptide--D-alanyl-D-alanine ligase [Corynebacterium silvaticum]TFA93927.1 UDP